MPLSLFPDLQIEERSDETDASLENCSFLRDRRYAIIGCEVARHAEHSTVEFSLRKSKDDSYSFSIDC